MPAFIGNSGPSQQPFGGKKYLWGNMPAVDMLGLTNNEGGEYVEDLHLLFAGTHGYDRTGVLCKQLMASQLQEISEMW